jgi:hypothetical protein
VIVTILAILIAVLILIGSCVVLPKSLWKIAGGFEIGLGVATPLLFVALATEFCRESDISCKPDSAIYMAIPSLLCFAVTGLSLWFLKERTLTDVVPHDRMEAPPPATAPVVEAVVMGYAEPVVEAVAMK